MMRIEPQINRVSEAYRKVIKNVLCQKCVISFLIHKKELRRSSLHNNYF